MRGSGIEASYDYARSTVAATVGYQWDRGSAIHADDATAFHSVDVGTSYRLFIGPIPGSQEGSMRITSSEAQLSETGIREATAPDLVDERPAYVVNVEGTAAVETLGLVDINVSAPFRLVLWRVNGTLETPDASQRIWSGDSVAPILPYNETTLVASEIEDRMLFMDVPQGWLVASLEAKNIYRMHVGAPSVQVDGTTTVRKDGQPQSLVGAYECRVLGVSDGLEVVFNEMSPDGEDVPVEIPASPETAQPQSVAVQPSPEASQWPPSVAWLAGLGLALLVIVGSRPVHDWDRKRRLALAFEAGMDAKVIRLADRLAGRRRHRWEAGTMKVVSLARSGRTDEAYRTLLSIEDLPEATPEGLTYLEACVEAAQGDRRQAGRIVDGLLGVQAPDSNQGYA